MAKSEKQKQKLLVLLDILIGYPVKEKRKKIRKESGKIISYNSY